MLEVKNKRLLRCPDNVSKFKLVQFTNGEMKDSAHFDQKIGEIQKGDDDFVKYFSFG